MDLAIRRDRPVERTALGDGSSWVDRRRGWPADLAGLTDWLSDTVTWRRTEVLRYDHYRPERRLSGSVRRDDLHPAVVQTGLYLRRAYGHDLSGPAFLQYRNGEDFQGLHSDREMRWLDDTLVGLLIVGEPRPFTLRPRSAKAIERFESGDDASRDVVLDAGEGDLLVLGGRCQRDWLHGVPRAPTTGPRFSVMWRWARRSGRPDTNPSYSDGRQFSDHAVRPGRRNV